MARRSEIERLGTVAARFYPRDVLIHERWRLFGNVPFSQMTDRQRRLLTHWLRALNALGWARALLNKRLDPPLGR